MGTSVSPWLGVDNEARIVGAEYWFGDRARREGHYYHWAGAYTRSHFRST